MGSILVGKKKYVLISDIGMDFNVIKTSYG
jgi:hypothetical protein